MLELYTQKKFFQYTIPVRNLKKCDLSQPPAKQTGRNYASFILLQKETVLNNLRESFSLFIFTNANSGCLKINTLYLILDRARLENLPTLEKAESYFVKHDSVCNIY